jgi:hypothetical protein
MSPREAVACYRLNAVECRQMAAHVEDAGHRLALLSMAQAWFRLADQVSKAGVSDAVTLTENLPNR